jgi:TolA-binding protein
VQRLLIFLTLASLATAAPDSPELKAAEQALHDQLPEVALTKLERLLATPKLPEVTQQRALLLSVEAAVRAGKAVRGIELSDKIDLSTQPELAFWRASALQAAGRYRDALDLLVKLPAEEIGPLTIQAKFNQAAVLMGLGEATEAITLLRHVGQSNDPAVSQRAQLWLAEAQLEQRDLPAAQATLAALPTGGNEAQKQYLLGKLEFAQGHGSVAAQRFAQVVAATDPAARSLHLPGLLGLARSQRVQDQKAAAARTLAELIAASPSPAFLELVFQEFRLVNTPPDPELDKLLLGWSDSNDVAVSAPAHLALIESREATTKIDDALQLCASFIKKYPTHPLLVEVLLRQSRMLIAQGKGDIVVQLLAPLQQPDQPPQVQAWANEVLGYAKLRAGNFSEAIKAFKIVTAKTPEPEKRLLATYQTALAKLQASAPEALPDLSEISLPAGLEADLEIERGLYAASKASPDTERYLQTFLKRHSDHARAFIAALALAEYSLQKSVKTPDLVRNRILTAEQLAKTPAEKERATILSLHFDSLTATPEAFAKKADEFLTSHAPGSPWRADLLFRLAERLHNAQQYAPAKVRFLQLVKEEPDSVEVEAALFFAGKAALGSLTKGCEEEAIKLWDQVAQGKGPLRLQARLEQGKLDQRRDPAAALQIFDAILKSVPPPNASLKHQVLCLRGETLLVQGLESPAKVTEALATFDQVISSNAASIYWRQQAQVRKGDCLVSLKQEPEAIEAYYEAMNLTLPATTANAMEADNFWFFRAGEKAIRLLEAKQNWKAAVAIAQKLAEAPGPRADSSRERANRLITEHYLWQDE